MLRPVIALAASVVGVLGGCADVANEETDSVAEQSLTSACANDYKLVAFIDAPQASSGAGRSGTGPRRDLVDVDGDGLRDIVHISPGASSNPLVSGGPMTFDVTALRSDGAGSFTEETSRLQGHHAEALYTGDFDGDGRLDVAYLRYGANELWVVLRDLAGGWKPASRISVPLCNLSHLYVRPNSVVVRDFDGDGKADLLANIRTSDVRAATVLLRGASTGLANGSCLSATDPSDRRWTSSRTYDWLLEKSGHLRVGDFDGDGKLDAIGHDGRQGAVIADIFGERRWAGAAMRDEAHVVGRYDDNASDDVVSLLDGGYRPKLGGVFLENGRTTILHDEITDVVWFDLPLSRPTPGGGRAPGPLQFRHKDIVIGDFNADGQLDFLLHFDDFFEAPLVKNGATLAPTMCSRAGASHRQYQTHVPIKDGRPFKLVGAANLDGVPGDEIVAYYPAADGKPPAYAVYTLK